MAYKRPSHVLEVLKQIGYEEWMPARDPRYVDTQAARGSEKTFARLARKFGWDPATNAFFAPNEKHELFFGHIAPRAPGRRAREGRRAMENRLAVAGGWQRRHCTGEAIA